MKRGVVFHHFFLSHTICWLYRALVWDCPTTDKDPRKTFKYYCWIGCYNWNNVMGLYTKKLHRANKQLSLVISKADKDNSLVILTRINYISKIETFLIENGLKKLIETSFLQKLWVIANNCGKISEEYDTRVLLLSSTPSTSRFCYPNGRNAFKIECVI